MRCWPLTSCDEHTGGEEDRRVLSRGRESRPVGVRTLEKKSRISYLREGGGHVSRGVVWKTEPEARVFQEQRAGVQDQRRNFLGDRPRRKGGVEERMRGEDGRYFHCARRPVYAVESSGRIGGEYGILAGV